MIYQPGVAEAATKKPSIAKTMTIPIGKLDSKVCWNKNSYEIEKAKKLTVKNKVKGATYTFKSSNTKIAQIDKKGGYLTGIKDGSATITCTQKYKNKTSTIGKCKVTVKKAAIELYEYDDMEFAVGSNDYKLYAHYAALEPIYQITYRNPKATYKLTSDSKDFSIKEVKFNAKSAKDVTKDPAFIEELERFMGDNYFYGYEFTAKKAGTYKVTVKETYNKKTTSLGSFKVVVKDTSLADTDVEMILGDSIYLNSLLLHQNAYKMYYCIIEDFDSDNKENNPLVIRDYSDSVTFYANKAGTAKVSIREGSEDGVLLGTVNFVITEVPCQKIEVQKDEYTVYEGKDYFGIYFRLDPWNTTDKVTVTSDNPDVINVTNDNEYGDWEYKVGKVGKATITISCGEQSVERVVTVLADDAEAEDD